eukprot:s16_g41.t1
MRLNSLLGLGGKAAQEPANKRQKRSDVLQSLGLGGPSKPAAKAAQPKPQRPTLGLAELSALGEPDTPQPAAEAVKPPADGPSEPAANGSNGDGVQKAQAQAWRNAFAQAQDQWSVSENRERCFYHDTQRELFFEWDQAEGLLFQYFSQGEEKAENAEKGSVERAPIWSAACPETHAEVWQVLPMPPTDPGAELQVSEEAAEAEAAPASAQAQAAPSASEDAKTEAPANPAVLASAETSMLPPPPKKKRLPPVPIMAPSAPEDDDEDDGDLRLPESRGVPSVVMGCEGPPPAPPAPASSSSSVAAEEDEEPDDPGGRSLVLEEGEEVDDLAAEECALPQAPAPIDFTATDVDLDIFG